MSALGQNQTSNLRSLMSALPPKADIAGRQLDVRFVPKADIQNCALRSADHACSCCVVGLVPVVAAHINPSPTMATRNLTPAGIICVVIDRTTKAEREEIAMVESVVEMIMEVAPRSAPVPPLDWPCGHRASCHWSGGHRTARHRGGGHWAPMHGWTAHASTTTTHRCRTPAAHVSCHSS